MTSISSPAPFASVFKRCNAETFHTSVFDWFRTNLYYKHSDGSTSLSYSEEDFKKLDKHNLRLPGWDESYTSEQLNGLLKELIIFCA